MTQYSDVALVVAGRSSHSAVLGIVGNLVPSDETQTAPDEPERHGVIRLSFECSSGERTPDVPGFSSGKFTIRPQRSIREVPVQASVRVILHQPERPERPNAERPYRNPIGRRGLGWDAWSGVEPTVQERGELYESNRHTSQSSPLPLLTPPCPSSSPGRHKRTQISVLPSEPCCTCGGSTSREMEGIVEAQVLRRRGAAMAVEVDSGEHGGGPWLRCGGVRPAGLWGGCLLRRRRRP